MGSESFKALCTKYLKENREAFASADEPSYKAGLNLHYPMQLDLQVEAVEPTFDIEAEIDVEKHTDFLEKWFLNNTREQKHAHLLNGFYTQLQTLSVQEDKVITIDRSISKLLLVCNAKERVKVTLHVKTEGSFQGLDLAIINEGADVHLTIHNVAQVDKQIIRISSACYDGKIEIKQLTLNESDLKMRYDMEMYNNNELLIHNLFLNNSQQDIITEIYHQGTKNSSIIRSLGLVKKKFFERANITAHETAYDGFVNQELRALLLTNEASAALVPELDVNNNLTGGDHAAVIINPDKDLLFYLASRGIGADQGVRLIVEGLLHAMVGEDVPQEQVNQFLEDYVHN